jgi:hypothetical protein
MDINKLKKILIWLGGFVTLAALLWWAKFFNEPTNGNLGEALSCLYSSSGMCGVVSGISQFSGSTPYNPIIFWVGVISLFIGIILKFSMKDGSSST